MALYRNTYLLEMNVKKCVMAFRGGGLDPKNLFPSEYGHDMYHPHVIVDFRQIVNAFFSSHTQIFTHVYGTTAVRNERDDITPGV